MRKIQDIAAVALAGIAALTWATCVSAEDGRGHRYRVPHHQQTTGPGPEGRGCYWMRQRLYCSRYCYVEVDGRRYCQERARLAYPQAPYYEDVRPERHLK